MDNPGSCPGIVKWGHFKNKDGCGVYRCNYFRVAKKGYPRTRLLFPGSLPVVGNTGDIVPIASSQPRRFTQDSK